MAKAFEKVMDSRKEIVTKVIEMMEQGFYFNTPEWRKAFATPYNPESGTVYRGGNKFRLMLVEMRQEYHDPRWMTFHQMKNAGYQLKPGQHGILCEKWIFSENNVEEEEKAEGKGSKEEQPEKHDKENKSEARAMVSYFYVFNAQQVNGYPEYKFETCMTEDRHLQLADELKEVWECPVYEKIQNDAYYHPQKDYVMLPTRHSFKSSEAFAATMLHEMAHSTGHHSRLNRSFEGAFGSKGYAKEELIAELSTLFTSGDLGLSVSEERLQDNSDYLKSWIQILNDDPNELFRICADADRASERIVKRYAENYEWKLPSRIRREELEEITGAQYKESCNSCIIGVNKSDYSQEKTDKEKMRKSKHM